jgi:mannose/fructose-specific phosphotransferase system component IIA
MRANTGLNLPLFVEALTLTISMTMLSKLTNIRRMYQIKKFANRLPLS